MIWPERNCFSNIRLEDYLDQKDYRHVMKKISKSISITPCVDGVMEGEYLDSSDDYASWEGCKLLFLPNGFRLIIVNDKQAFVMEYNPFIKFRRFKATIGMIDGFARNQRYHYERKTSYLNKEESKMFFKPSRRSRTRRLLAEAGFIV